MAAWKAIPGETPIDPSGLRDKSIRTRKQLNEAEGRNIAAAVFKYLIGPLTPAMSPFDLAWALKLHEEMFGNVWEWAGQLRTIDLNLGVSWRQVETRLYDLLQSVPYWKEMPLMEQAARLHHEAVSIHPFENGNGRWARMLANIWLKLKGSSPTFWPEESVGETSVIRDEYLNAIKAADAMDFALLIALHEKYSTVDAE
jgi:Fic-DOC domain mobile mystery protein B